MNNKTLQAILSIVALNFFACNKCEIHTTANPNFLPLSVGNYWIYEYYDVDTNGLATAKGQFDSCYVEKDTSINNKLYYKLIKPYYFSAQYEILFVRDSAQHIVTETGLKLFSAVDFGAALYQYYINNASDTICFVQLKMQTQADSVLTPAGKFNALNAQSTFQYMNNHKQAGGLNKLNNYYVPHVGLVIETMPFYMSDIKYKERRLLRYHLQ